MVESSSVTSLLVYTFKKFISHVLSTKHQGDIDKRNNSCSERFHTLWTRLAMTLQEKDAGQHGENQGNLSGRST